MRKPLIALLLALALPASASAGIVFTFSPTNPKPGTKFVFVAAVFANDGYTGPQLPDTATSYDLYLVRNADAPFVHDASDPRLVPIGFCSEAFGAHCRVRLPHLGAGSYAIAARCLNCGSRKLYVIGVGGPDVTGQNPLMLLHVSSSRSFPMWPVVGIGALLALAVLFAAWRARVFLSRRNAGDLWLVARS